MIVGMIDVSSMEDRTAGNTSILSVVEIKQYKAMPVNRSQ